MGTNPTGSSKSHHNSGHVKENRGRWRLRLLVITSPYPLLKSLLLAKTVNLILQILVRTSLYRGAAK